MLSGHTQGANREELLKNAREQAFSYFNTNCVTIELRDVEAVRDCMINNITGETTTTKITFEARFRAKVEHNYWQKFTTHGPLVCRVCDEHQ